MKQSVPAGSEQVQARQSPSVVDVVHAGESKSFVDNRPETIAQRQLMDTIRSSPRMAAQRNTAEIFHNSLRMVTQRNFHSHMHSPIVQLQAAPEEELLQGKFDSVQRAKEEPLQGRFPVQSLVQLEQRSAAKPNNTGLPDNLKSGIESLSGISMDSVRVHYNSSQPVQLNALAYAQGTDIHVAPGQEQHLPHEAWHVVQQIQGRVKANKQLKGEAPINDEVGLEREAGVMGAKAASMAFTWEPAVQVVRFSGADSGVAQRVVVQSDWLKHGEEGMELAKSSAGPWEKCEDKTNEGYRNAAEKALGSLDSLNTLSKYGVIPEATMSGRGPLARSHLIGAAFGGQLKYTPTENIRYHPLALEYGPWQKDETVVEKTARRGYITARSTSLGPGHAFLMSREIGDLVASEYGFVAGLHVARQIESHLQASEAVPVSASFSYNDVDTPALDFAHSWDGLDSVLRVLPVPANHVFAAMDELKLPLPSGVVLAAGSNDIPVNTRTDMLQKIDALSLSSGAKQNLFKKINNLKALVAAGTISLAVAADAINKHPHLKTKPGNWVLGASFSSWEDLV